MAGVHQVPQSPELDRETLGYRIPGWWAVRESKDVVLEDKTVQRTCKMNRP